MKRFILLVLILTPTVCYASYSSIINYYNAAASGGVNPEVQYNCDDNTTGNAVVATFGSNGTIFNETNSSSSHSATAAEGTGSFLFSGTNMYLLTAVLTDADYEDGDFTIQWYMYTPTTDTYANFERIFEALGGDGGGTELLMNIVNDTTVNLYVDGIDEGTWTVSDLTSSSWHLFRLVCNGTSCSLYQGTNEGDLSSVGAAKTITTPDFTNFQLRTGGNGDTGKSLSNSNGQLDQVKIWGESQTP